MIEANPNDKRALELNKEKLKDYILFKEKTEKKFFGLLNQLHKAREKDFIKDVQQYKDELLDYQERSAIELNDLEEGTDEYAHKLQIVNRLRHISKHFG